jgi:hypothetical protein
MIASLLVVVLVFAFEIGGRSIDQHQRHVVDRGDLGLEVGARLGDSEYTGDKINLDLVRIEIVGCSYTAPVSVVVLGRGGSIAGRL